jgi:hypothetical protein
MQQGQSNEQTGTRDDTYDVISVVYHALQGAENCQIYAEDAEDGQLRDFFQRACDQQRQLADQGKQVLKQCLQNEGGQGGQSMSGQSSSGGSAFGFDQGQSQNQSSDSRSETVTSGSPQTGTGIG